MLFRSAPERRSRALGSRARHQRGDTEAGCALTRQAECAESSGGLSADERERLREPARLLRAVDHAIRLVTGRGAAQLPRGPRAELVAELAGGFLGEDLTAEALSRRLEETRQGVRTIYLRVFA